VWSGYVYSVPSALPPGELDANIIGTKALPRRTNEVLNSLEIDSIEPARRRESCNRRADDDSSGVAVGGTRRRRSAAGAGGGAVAN
jgi:hypothetical protein